MKILLATAAGGALGAAGRYGVGVWAVRIFGHGYPWGTIIVNIVGCFAMGLIIKLLSSHVGANNELRAFLTTGMLGGFTTFSAFSLDFATMFERNDYGVAALYVTLSVGLSLMAIFLGLFAGRLIWS